MIRIQVTAADKWIILIVSVLYCDTDYCHVIRGSRVNGFSKSAFDLHIVMPLPARLLRRPALPEPEMTTSADSSAHAQPSSICGATTLPSCSLDLACPVLM